MSLYILVGQFSSLASASSVESFTFGYCNKFVKRSSWAKKRTGQVVKANHQGAHVSKQSKEAKEHRHKNTAKNTTEQNKQQIQETYNVILVLPHEFQKLGAVQKRSEQSNHKK